MADSAEQSTGLAKSTRSTVVVMACTLGSRLLGFLRMAVIGALFGAQGEADVLNAVFSIPNNLRKLLAEGALSSAFIPTLSRCLNDKDSPDKANHLASTLLGFQLVILIPLSLASIVAAEPIIYLLTGFSDPEKTVLAIALFRWVFHYILLISISSVLMAVLNTHGSFTIPAVTPILFSIAVIGSLLFLHERMGIFAMAVGVLLGGVGQILFQLPLYLKKGYSVKPSLHFQTPEFKAILAQWLPILGTSSIFAINQQIALRFATGLVDGSASALTNALVFWQLPFGIFSASITTVLFPRMSLQAAQRDFQQLGRTLEYGLRAQITLLLPSALYLIILGEPLIAVALQRGAFNYHNTRMAARVLTAYSLGLFSVGAFNFMQRYYYSLGNFRTPFITSIILSIVDIILSLWWKNTFLGVAGLALANTAAFTLGFCILLWGAKRRSAQAIRLKEVLKTLGKVSLSVLLPIMVTIGVLKLTGNWWTGGSSGKGFLGLIVLLLAIVVLQVLGFVLFKVEMIWVILRKKDVKELG